MGPDQHRFPRNFCRSNETPSQATTRLSGRSLSGSPARSLFKAAFGTSVPRFVVNRRVERAASYWLPLTSRLGPSQPRSISYGCERRAAVAPTPGAGTRASRCGHRCVTAPTLCGWCDHFCDHFRTGKRKNRLTTRFFVHQNVAPTGFEPVGDSAKDAATLGRPAANTRRPRSRPTAGRASARAPLRRPDGSPSRTRDCRR